MERLDLVGDLFFGETHQGAPNQSPQRQRVTGVGDDSRDGDQVLDLLPAIEALSGLSGDGNLPVLEGLLIDPETGPGGGEQSDVSGPRRPE